jgi:Envelope integrity protein A
MVRAPLLAMVQWPASINSFEPYWLARGSGASTGEESNLSQNFRDAGADGARTMMLVYNLPRMEAIFDRFGGIAGSAYFVGGLGMTALTGNDIVVVPIRSGLGLRLGANLGYLKFTERPTWNSF